MTRQRLHTAPVKFTLRIENRLNEYLTAWAKEEGKSKGLLIESIIGAAVNARRNSCIIRAGAVVVIDEAGQRGIDSRASMEASNEAMREVVNAGRPEGLKIEHKDDTPSG